MKKATRFRAVVLAGGSGERFWPLSTKEKPKQFLNVFGGVSLLRQSVTRLEKLATPEGLYVITAKDLVGLTRKELPEVPPRQIVGEPCRRDTGAAIALGTGLAGAANDDVIGFFASDHLGYVDPKTGAFVEKPDARKAKQYLKKGYLWNAGLFIARASVFRAAIAAYAPALKPLTESAVFSAVRLARLYEPLPRISFDYAVMEKSANVAVIRGDFGWDDVGGFQAFDRYFPHDKKGNVREGPCRVVSSAGNICVVRGAPISLLGVSNLVVITTPQGVLVANKRHLSDMKKLFQTTS